MPKNYFIIIFLSSYLSYLKKIVREFIIFLRLYNFVDIMQSMNGIVCRYNLLCLENYITKKSDLMILNNSGIDHARMLLFVFGFLIYW